MARVMTAFTVSLAGLIFTLSLSASAPAASRPQSADCVRLAHDDLQTTSLEFNLQSLSLQTVNDSSGIVARFEVPGEGMTYEFGKPVLPAVSRFVVVPPDAGLELVVNADAPEAIPAEHPPQVCSDSEVASIQPAHNRESFNGNPPDLYPAVYAEMSAPMNIRGARLVRITTYPVQYDRIRNCYLKRDRIEAEVRYTNDAPVNPVKYPIRRHRSAAFKNFIRGLAVNGANVGRDDPDNGEPPGYLGHYLVVTHPNCLEYAAPFIEWRRKQGYRVDIFRVPSDYCNAQYWIEDSIKAIYDNYLEKGEDPFDELFLIGDQESHAGWVLASSYNVGGDWDYACLEGGDDEADVGVSRWCSGSEDLMELFSRRTLSYEVTPYMANTDWFTRGAVYSQKWGGNWDVSLNINVRWAIEVMQSLGFTDVRFQEDIDHTDSDGGIVGPFIKDQFSDGVNVMVGRAEDYYLANNVLDDHASVFPVDIDLAGHGEYATWAILRNGSGDNLKGPVAATCGSGNSPTLPYSVAWMEAVNGFLQRDLPYGWARLQATVAPGLYYPDFDDYDYCKNDVAFYGDPGLQYWRGVPQILADEAPSSEPADAQLIEVRVKNKAGGAPVSGAMVALYAPGDMPAYDNAAYGSYKDMRMAMHESDADGWARFVIDQPFNNDDKIFLTISGRDILPLLDTIKVKQPGMAVNLGGYRLDEIVGNGDDRVNPGESFNLYLTASNLSANRTARDVTAVVTSQSGYVTTSDDTIGFGDIDANSTAEAETPIRIDLNPSCPDGASRPSTRPVLIVTFGSGGDRWRTAIQLDPYSPNLEVSSVLNGIIVPTRNRALNVKVKNAGRISSDALQVKVVPLSPGKISIIMGQSRYDGIAAGREDDLAGDQFSVAALTISIPGTVVPMALVFSRQDVVVDSAMFELQLREPSAGTPQGPDPYGYICFDDADDDWEIAPKFEWVEISTREQDREFNGTRLDFKGNPPQDIGEALVIPLPFANQFYGHIYDTITVGTNGFIAMGDQPLCVNFQNWPMDRCIGGGVGMLAPFWDNLRLGKDESDVSYYYDDNDHRFIVEWHKMKLAEGGDVRQTFEVILYDHDVWITETGDQNILFQYKAITDGQNGEYAWSQDVPYSSVGISSPDGNAGINYYFNKIYPVTSAHLRSQRALLFATAPKYKAARIWGRVTDFATGLPIAEAALHTRHNFTAISDVDGNWEMPRVLAEVEFDISVSKPGYNDSTLLNLEVPEDSSAEINFALLHPEFGPSTRNLYAMIDSSRSAVLPYTIQNDGNGPLDWTMARRLPRGADVDPWTRRVSYNVGHDLGDNRINGVVFAEGKLYIAGGNSPDNKNWLYVLDKDGQLVDEFEQPGATRYGFQDMAYDDDLIWGSGGRMVYSVDPGNGAVVDSFTGPAQNNAALAWDSDRELLWASGLTTSEIIGVNRNGNPIADIDQCGLYVYGMAYWPEDPGHPLYLLTSPNQTRQFVYKMNPDNGDTVYVTELQPGSGGPGGIEITNQYDVYSWILMAVANDADSDRVDVWQLDTRRDWFVATTHTPAGWVSADSGRINAGERRDFRLYLNTANLIKALFEGYLVYGHNAAGGLDTINVGLEVIGPHAPLAFNLAQPADGDTIYAGSQVQFTWERSVDPNFGESATYRAWFSAAGATVSAATADTSLTVDVGTLDLNIAADTTFTWWVEAVSGADVVESTQRFALKFLLEDLKGREEAPVVFGLQRVYPSPFNPATTIRFGADRAERVAISAYDVTGRLVATLYDGITRVGYHQLTWDAATLPAGVYLLRLQSGERVQTAKVALVK